MTIASSISDGDDRRVVGNGEARWVCTAPWFVSAQQLRHCCGLSSLRLEAQHGMAIRRVRRRGQTNALLIGSGAAQFPQHGLKRGSRYMCWGTTLPSALTYWGLIAPVLCEPDDAGGVSIPLSVTWRHRLFTGRFVMKRRQRFKWVNPQAATACATCGSGLLIS
jgi:hypothetical protein